jgi:hypothetical protein
VLFHIRGSLSHPRLLRASQPPCAPAIFLGRPRASPIESVFTLSLDHPNRRGRREKGDLRQLRAILADPVSGGAGHGIRWPQGSHPPASSIEAGGILVPVNFVCYPPLLVEEHRLTYRVFCRAGSQPLVVAMNRRRLQFDDSIDACGDAIPAAAIVVEANSAQGPSAAEGEAPVLTTAPSSMGGSTATNVLRGQGMRTPQRDFGVENKAGTSDAGVSGRFF